MTADRAIKEPCRAATTGNITLSGLQTIDGVALSAGDRVLVRAQTSAVNNGIYDAASGGWTRAGDMDGAGEVVGGTQVLVTSGTEHAGSAFRVAGAGAITIGAGAIAFEPAYDSDSVAFRQAGSGALVRTVEEKLRESLSLAEFGYVADGTTDDTAAWQAAIAAAAALEIRTIRVPFGATGVSLVAGQIVNGPLPSGLTFEGEGRGHASDYETGMRLKYTGSGTCWFIDHNPPVFFGEEGRWTWRNLGFEATDPYATMFDFNNVLGHGTVTDNGPRSFLSHVRFESCYFLGAWGGENQTGDAIRGAKLFHLVVDENCYIRGWRRGIWLYGCDNSTLAPRAYINGRNIMIEGSGTYGNDNRIDCRFLGGPYSPQSEDSYLFWDNGNSSTYVSNFIEDFAGGTANQSKALCYLNGFMTTLIAPHFAAHPSDIPVFHLGPHAVDVTILHAKISVVEPTVAPIIDDPVSTDLGYFYANHRLTIVGASRIVQAVVGAHPRIVYKAKTEGGNVLVDQDREMLADAAGYRPRSRMFNAINVWGQNGGTEANAGISSFEQDASVAGGWVCRLDQAIVQSGINLPYVVGTDVMPGDLLQIAIRQKNSGVSGLAFISLKNNVYYSTLAFTSNTGGGYATDVSTVDLSGWAVGDVLRIEIYRGATGGSSVDVHYIHTRVVRPAIADLSIAAVAGVSGAGNNAASKADVDTAFAGIVAKFNALKDVLEARGDLAG